MSKADQTWRKDVDERLLQKCEQHERDGRRFVFQMRIRTYAAAPRVHVTPEDWGAGHLRVPREWDIPLQLTEDLRHSSPQSLLRDLYRPVMPVRWHQYEPIEGTAREPFTAIAEARKARMDRRVTPRVEPVLRTVIAYQYWRIGMMTERWEPSLPDDAPRRYPTGIPAF